MCVTTGTSPDFLPIAIVSSMPAFELKLDSGVTRSWLVKLVRAGRATSTTLITSSVFAKYPGL